jgi:hypothetical protein
VPAPPDGAPAAGAPPAGAPPAGAPPEGAPPADLPAVPAPAIPVAPPVAGLPPAPAAAVIPPPPPVPPVPLAASETGAAASSGAPSTMDTIPVRSPLHTRSEEPGFDGTQASPSAQSSVRKQTLPAAPSFWGPPQAMAQTLPSANKDNARSSGSHGFRARFMANLRYRNLSPGQVRRPRQGSS